MSDASRTHTVRLELVDEPGELLRALDPVAEHGGNLLSVFHERGNVTPRGRIPVEIDLECPEGRFEEILGGLREAGVRVAEADTERYREGVTVVLVGHLVDTDLSGTLSAVESRSGVTVVDLSLSAPEGTDGVSAARLELAVEPGRRSAALAAVREVAEDKDLSVIDPVGTGGDARPDGGVPAAGADGDGPDRVGVGRPDR